MSPVPEHRDGVPVHGPPSVGGGRGETRERERAPGCAMNSRSRIVLVDARLVQGRAEAIQQVRQTGLPAEDPVVAAPRRVHAEDDPVDQAVVGHPAR